MWKVKVDPQAAVEAEVEVVLVKDNYGKGLLEGKPGQMESGFCFYALVPTEDGLVEEYTTFTFGDKSVLAAVSKSQYSAWKKKYLIAKPCTITWKVDEPVG